MMTLKTEQQYRSIDWRLRLQEFAYSWMAFRCYEGSTRPSVLYRSAPVRVATWEHIPSWMGSAPKLPVNVARLSQSAG
jgi:hypothetical protein